MVPLHLAKLEIDADVFLCYFWQHDHSINVLFRFSTIFYHPRQWIQGIYYEGSCTATSYPRCNQSILCQNSAALATHHSNMWCSTST